MSCVVRDSNGIRHNPQLLLPQHRRGAQAIIALSTAVDYVLNGVHTALWDGSDVFTGDVDCMACINEEHHG